MLRFYVEIVYKQITFTKCKRESNLKFEAFLFFYLAVSDAVYFYNFKKESQIT